jgi:hypothetical protein
MSSAIVHRRAAKANRRKQLKAERRRHDPVAATEPPESRMRRLARHPLDACLVHAGLFETGCGMILLTRGTGSGRRALAAFLVDVHCLGVKDAFFRELDEPELEMYLAALNEAAPLEPADPCHARKLLRDAVAYARSLGLGPHADYAACELLFGAHSADDCAAEFSFGVDGRPVYMPGPGETPMQIRQRLRRLFRRLGPDGFDFVAPAGDWRYQIAEQAHADVRAANRR